jgi:outer membrane usher protein
MRLIDAGYETLGLTTAESRPRSELSAFFSMPVGGGVNASLQHTQATAQDGTTRTRSDLVMTRRLGGYADLIASAARTDEGRGPRMEASVAMTILLGRRTSMTSTVSRTGAVTRGSFDLQRPMPMGTGYGFQLRSEPEKGGTPTGAVQYQGAHGRYEARYQSSGGQANGSVNISGALVAIGGGVFATRPVRGSYALVQVPGVKGVRGFSSNQEIGRTNGRGQIFVPDLLPYYANVLNIADTDVPIDYTLSRVRETVAPPFRGGVLVKFPVRRVQHSQGRVLIVVDGTERAPAYGELAVTIDGTLHVSPVGAGGEFYFEDLPVGRHPASIEFGGGKCALTLEVPTAETMVANLGTVRCTPGGR